MQINVNLIYPIGSIYMTTSTVSPAVLFGGTWERITADAYLKIATGTNAGNLGGTSPQRKMPVQSLPSHQHTHINWNGASVGLNTGGSQYNLSWDKQGVTNDNSAFKTGYTGGGQTYYPYYYGVFVWRQIE